MGQHSFSARYTATMAKCGARCPIEIGVLSWLADHECRHGRLPFDRAQRAVWARTLAIYLPPVVDPGRSVGTAQRRVATIGWISGGPCRGTSRRAKAGPPFRPAIRECPYLVATTGDST